MVAVFIILAVIIGLVWWLWLWRELRDAERNDEWD
jgi:hypothetical protein